MDKETKNQLIKVLKQLLEDESLNTLEDIVIDDENMKNVTPQTNTPLKAEYTYALTGIEVREVMDKTSEMAQKFNGRHKIDYLQMLIIELTHNIEFLEKEYERSTQPLVNRSRYPV